MVKNKKNERLQKWQRKKIRMVSYSSMIGNEGRPGNMVALF